MLGSSKTGKVNDDKEVDFTKRVSGAHRVTSEVNRRDKSVVEGVFRGIHGKGRDRNKEKSSIHRLRYIINNEQITNAEWGLILHSR